MSDHYEILGVDRSADGDAIKRAYRQKARTLHPDAGGNAEDFARLNLAYDTLANAERRAHYDRTGQNEQPVAPDEIRARILLDELLRKYVDMPDQTGRYTFDLIKAIRHDLNEGERLIPIFIKEVQEKIAALERLIGRVDGGLLIGTITQMARQLEARIIHFDAERAAIAKARLLLEGCKHTPERDIQTSYRPPRGSI